eukprot:TRINITY_DN881_c0_g1_i1.p1 TRINITY_DN881_c0_g1~~TRINITY_DN881_c0_g1_i1.p1  ORF type:complete len:564 (-),score=100.83 TRINITY_DN881_c0_g1_i1:24-1715(-)
MEEDPSRNPPLKDFYKEPINLMWPALWRTMPPDFVLKATGDGTELKKCLNWLDLLTYGVASTVGAGIFVTLGAVVAGNINAGPSCVFSFLIAAVASLFSAFCYSEFAARIPVSGSAYTFSYVALGEIVGWLIGWNLTLEYSIGAAAVARGWGNYFIVFFQGFSVIVPDYIAGTTIDEDIDLGPLTVFIILLCTLIILLGMKESAMFNLFMTCFNITLILFIIILGSTQVDTANWSPFVPNGVQPILQGTGTLFFSYIGFDAVSTLAGEVKKPSRDLPIGIVGTLGVVTVLYVGVALVITGMVPYRQVDENAPLSVAFTYVGLGWASQIVAAGSVSTLTANVLASLIGQPRVFLQMSKDGLLWEVFGLMNSRQIPVFSTIATAILAGFIGFFLSIEDLSNMISIGTLMAFTIVCAGVVILRYRPKPGEEDQVRIVGLHPRWIPHVVILFVICAVGFASCTIISGFPWWGYLIVAIPLAIIYLWLQVQKVMDVPETFQCPLVPLIPCLGIVINVTVILSLPIDAIYRVLIWSALGLLIYFTYGINHSKLNQLGKKSLLVEYDHVN